MKQILAILLFLLILTALTPVYSQQRFPKPEFETTYTQPHPTTPEPRQAALEYLDVLVLIAVLALAAFLALRLRSRKGIFWVSVFSLVYFGFYRDGCICPIGAIQNLTLSFTDPGYSISLPALLFFLLPLLAALFFGRIFCGAACPLGAIQDLLVIKPLSLPAWLRKSLGTLPYIYLGLAVLYAATKTDFIICRYDPFIGIFRMNTSFNMLLLGVCFLVINFFVARPYCRFLCPYGVMLNWASRFSKWHLKITPSECIRCKLCEGSCPYDAISVPAENKSREAIKNYLPRFILYAVLIPVWMSAGGYAVSKSSHILSRANQDVYLAELLIAHPELKDDPDNIDIQTFLTSGKSLDTLVKESRVIQQQFHKGGWIFGAFLGLVFGIFLLNQVVFRKITDYEPHKGDCYSCGRCMDYCPVPE